LTFFQTRRCAREARFYAQFHRLAVCRRARPPPGNVLRHWARAPAQAV